MFPITITPIQDEKELKLLKGFILEQPQFYPKFKEWVDEKCIPRIESGIYKNLIAISKRSIIGDMIYRYLDENNIEIKNFRIDEGYSNRDLGHFLFRQLEVENPDCRLITDVTVDNFSGIQFMIRNGFNIISKENLYKPDQYEYILKK
jgi:hypothetical protein